MRDSGGRPVANATVVLQSATGQAHATPTRSHTRTQKEPIVLRRFRAGTYTSARGEDRIWRRQPLGPVSLAAKETKRKNRSRARFCQGFRIPEHLRQQPQTAKPVAPSEFFDEPQFTVAGVTQATNSGGHGSDTVLRTTEALAKATASLGKDTARKFRSCASARLRNFLTRNAGPRARQPGRESSTGAVTGRQGQGCRWNSLPGAGFPSEPGRSRASSPAGRRRGEAWQSTAGGSRVPARRGT